VSWSRFDDLYDDNRKVKKAWRLQPAAVGLHAMAITYSSRHETDGYVDLDWLEEKLPNARNRERVLRALVETGLLEAVDDGRFQVHDYLDYNPSSAQLQDRRRKDAERKARGVQKDSERNPDGIQTESARNPDGLGSAGAGPRPIPSPSQSQEETPAASPPSARAQEADSDSRAETVACPRCAATAGEQCDGARGKRDSCHLERHHAVGELTHISGKAKPTRGFSAPVSLAWVPSPEDVAMRDEHFPDWEVEAVANSAATLRLGRKPVTVEAVRGLLTGEEAA
jgi:hypothetical protein